MEAAAAELKAITEELAGAGGSIRLDMTLAGEMEYYNGLVFQGYLESLPRPVLKGGRYDLLMQKFTPGAGAIGFAVYLGELDRLSAPLPPVQQQKTEKTMLNVALPKGRLGDKVYDLLAGIGYGCPEDYNATRKLVVENPAAGIRYFLVKPSDVAIYVEHGAADVGIVGKDILTEASADVYELLDTGLGKCRMCVAAPADYKDDPSRPVRVATKFVNIAKSYYASIGRDIDIIKLNGSIELAPILGLSDVIVDIVETGTTLRENGLQVVTEFMPISARFIANKASYQFKHRQMDTMLEKAAAGKKFTMSVNDAWYIYSFYAGAGLVATLAEDGINTVCKMILNSGLSADWTVAIGLYNMLQKTLINNYFALFCAGGVLVSIPISILFVIMQKFYVEGITTGADKG